MTDASTARAAGPIRHRLEGELGRRLVHASGAVVPLGYLALSRVESVAIEWRWLQALLIVGVVVAAVLEVVRLRVGLDWWIFEHLTREYEQEKVAGYALYALSFAILALAFESRPGIALGGMLMLSIADPIGGMLGGEDPIPVKRPRALAGTFLVCLAIGLLLLPNPIAAVAAAAAATVADGVFWEVDGYVIDDNLGLPLAAAAAAWLVVALVPV